MKRHLLPLALATLLGAAGPLSAQTLRWASAGDPLTMDPVSQNESLTNMMNGQVYERLVMRDKQLGIVPALATGWQQTDATHWRFKLTTARPSPPTTWCSRPNVRASPPRRSPSTPRPWAR